MTAPAEIEADALERAARHLDALSMLDVRPGAATYLRERAAKLRAGDGWEDDRLLDALDDYENAPAEPRTRRIATLVTPCHPGCDAAVCFGDEDA